MKYEIEKVMRVVDELGSHLFHAYRAESIAISVQKAEDRYTVHLECPIADLGADCLDSLREKLSQRRKPEFEDYYWQLTGDALNPNALRLVSMMCDSIELDYRGGVLVIDLSRRAGDEPSHPLRGECP